MKACSDIDILSNHRKQIIDIGFKIKKKLSQIKKEKDVKEISGKLIIIKYSDIKDSWSVQDLLFGYYGKSTTLEILADKIYSMIIKGDAVNVKPMLLRIINKGVKNLKQPGYSSYKWVNINGNEKRKNLGNIGKGHFRWNYQSYVLNEKEIKHLKKFFKL